MIVDFFSKRKRGKKSISLYSTPEIAPNFPSTSATANTEIKKPSGEKKVDFFAEGNTFNRKKRKCKDGMADHIEKHENQPIIGKKIIMYLIFLCRILENSVNGEP